MTANVWIQIVLYFGVLALLAKPFSAIRHGQRLPDIDAQTARFEMMLLLFVIISLAATGGAV